MYFHYILKFCPAEKEGSVEKEALLVWIKAFEQGLKRNNQIRLFKYLLGHLLALSPAGKDGFYPAEAVREAIEIYGDESLENEYVITTCNMRGVYSPSGGAEERKIAKKYKDNADAIRIKAPKTAKIFDNLCERYLYEADTERESEEYAGI